MVMAWWWHGGGDWWVVEREKRRLEREEIRERSENIFILFLFYFILF